MQDVSVAGTVCLVMLPAGLRDARRCFMCRWGDSILIWLGWRAKQVGAGTARWPAAFADDVDASKPGRLRAAVLGAVVVGAVWLSWAAGSTLGVRHTGEADSSWRMLNAVSGAWSLISGITVYILGKRDVVRTPRWVVVSAAWIGSGRCSLGAAGNWPSRCIC